MKILFVDRVWIVVMLMNGLWGEFMEVLSKVVKWTRFWATLRLEIQ